MTVILCLVCGRDQPCGCPYSPATTPEARIAELESQVAALRRVISYAQVECQEQLELGRDGRGDGGALCRGSLG
jgi:hypothetical protein